MALVLYNSLTRQKESFISGPEKGSLAPSLGNPIKIYVCGVTVYDYCHLGHARTYIVWDTLRRYLRWRGYPVLYVQNFTDIDDKILKRAQETKITIQELTERFIAAYFEDMDRLNIERADLYPRATGSLPAMIQLVQDLELEGFAYRVRQDLASTSQSLGQNQPQDTYDVYYPVRQFARYGQLSGRRLEEMQAGASGRVGSPEGLKRDPFDFALWKSAPAHEPGFASPWGWGRPGWHLECSAMVRATLGDTIDIHAGGADLMFPHHENELAQSEPVTGKPLARFWLHNGFLNINGEKMSKSLGNFTTLRQALEHWDPMALRLFFLQTHYRSPIDLTEAGLTAAANGWQTLSKGIKAAQALSSSSDSSEEMTRDPSCPILARFQLAMDDDMGTATALAIAFDLAKSLISAHNTLVHTGSLPPEVDPHAGPALLTILGVLGLVDHHTPDQGDWDESDSQNQLSNADIEARIQQRAEARQQRDFATADRIRDELKETGITLIDQSGGGCRWIRD